MARKNKTPQQPIAAVKVTDGTTTIVVEPNAVTSQIIAISEEPTAQEELPGGAQEAVSRPTITARCEAAKELGACACRCRGKYHGKPHPDGWKDEEGCEPLTEGERKLAKKDTLNAWRRTHKDHMKAYMKNWVATSNAPTAVQMRTPSKRKQQMLDAEEAANAEMASQNGESESTSQ